jgi:hypothetical protein
MHNLSLSSSVPCQRCLQTSHMQGQSMTGHSAHLLPLCSGACQLHCACHLWQLI